MDFKTALSTAKEFFRVSYDIGYAFGNKQVPDALRDLGMSDRWATMIGSRLALAPVYPVWGAALLTMFGSAYAIATGGVGVFPVLLFATSAAASSAVTVFGAGVTIGGSVAAFDAAMNDLKKPEAAPAQGSAFNADATVKKYFKTVAEGKKPDAVVQPSFSKNSPKKDFVE